MTRHEPIVELVRGDLVESVHFGTVALLAPGEKLPTGLGDVNAPMYPRSAIKLVQAAAMVAHADSLCGGQPELRDRPGRKTLRGVPCSRGVSGGEGQRARDVRRELPGGSAAQVGRAMNPSGQR